MTDILAVALKIEQFGELYYFTLSDTLSDPEVKVLCEMLAIQEKSHVDLVKATILKHENENGVKVHSGLAFDPKKIFLGNHRNFESMTVTDFFDIAMELEETIMNLYVKGKSLTSSSETYQMFRSLVKFEKDHIRILKKEKQKYLLNKSSINKHPMFSQKRHLTKHF